MKNSEIQTNNIFCLIMKEENEVKNYFLSLFSTTKEDRNLSRSMQVCEFAHNLQKEMKQFHNFET